MVNMPCFRSTCAMSIVNLTSCVTNCMNILEAITWVALGFVPTIAAMEAAWRMSLFGRRSERIIAVRA